jgi:hypothetical protein
MLEIYVQPNSVIRRMTFSETMETLDIEGDEGGSMTADYGDVSAPPLHPDCRCYIRPRSVEGV